MEIEIVVPPRSGGQIYTQGSWVIVWDGASLEADILSLWQYNHAAAARAAGGRVTGFEPVERVAVVDGDLEVTLDWWIGGAE